MNSLEKQLSNIRNKLVKKSIGIAGAGGLGSNAAIALVRTGIGKLIVVDHDRVEKSNLTRQYYFIDQIGKLKVEALEENIRRINPDIEYIGIPKKLIPGEMEKPFRKVDVVIEALDDAETKTRFIEEILEKLPDKPIIAASGVTGYGEPDEIKTKHLGRLHICYDPDAKSCEEDILIASHVALIANWEADLAIEILLSEDI